METFKSKPVLPLWNEAGHECTKFNFSARSYNAACCMFPIMWVIFFRCLYEHLAPLRMPVLLYSPMVLCMSLWTHRLTCFSTKPFIFATKGNYSDVILVLLVCALFLSWLDNWHNSNAINYHAYFFQKQGPMGDTRSEGTLPLYCYVAVSTAAVLAYCNISP